MRNHEYETDSEERLREETDLAHEFLHCEHDRGDDVVPPWKGVAGPPAGVSHSRIPRDELLARQRLYGNRRIQAAPINPPITEENAA